MMMKRLIPVAILAASVPFAFSQEPSGTPTVPSAASVATPAPGETASPQGEKATVERAVEMATQTFEIIQTTTKILQGVKDKASADASAPEIAQLCLRLQQLHQEAEQWGGDPSSEVEQALMDHFEAQEEELRATVQRFLATLFPLISSDPCCYGSSALLEALKPLSQGIWGEDEEQDE